MQRDYTHSTYMYNLTVHKHKTHTHTLLSTCTSTLYMYISTGRKFAPKVPEIAMFTFDMYKCNSIVTGGECTSKFMLYTYQKKHVRC